MRIDEFLNDRGIEALQALHQVWLPGRALWGSKSALLRALREVMLEERAVARVCRRLCSGSHRVLRPLLRAPGLRLQVGQIFSRLPGGMHVSEVERELTALARLGLVHLESAGASGASSARAAEVPHELGALLLTLLQIDRRSACSLLSLAAHLRACGSEPARATALARNAPERLQGLASPALRHAIPDVIRRHGGIVGKRQLAALRLKSDPPALAEYRAELEAAQLGTVGGLSLWEFGIDLDETCLVIFQENVDAVLAQERAAEGAGLAPDKVGSGFLSNLRALVDYVSVHRLALTQTEELHRGAARRVSSRFAVATTQLCDEEALLRLTFELARAAGLVEVNDDGLLRPGARAAEWRARSLPERLADVADRLAECSSGGPNTRLASLCTKLAVELARRFAPGQWYPADAVVQRIISRLLLSVAARPGRLSTSDATEEGSASLQSASLKEVHESARRALGTLHAVGLVELGLRRRALEAVRLSDLAARTFGKSPFGVPAPGQVLIVNPDFEVILLPEGEVDEVAYRLGQFCEVNKTDQTHHFRITRGSVEEAAAVGLPAAEMLGVLERHSRTPVPQNVIYSIKSWTERVRLATLSQGWLLEANDAKTLDLICELPGLKELVMRRLSPVAVTLRDQPREQKVLLALRRLGVYLREQ